MQTCSNNIYRCLSDDNCKNIVEYLIGVLYNETKARLAYFTEYNVNIRNILLVRSVRLYVIITHQFSYLDPYLSQNLS